jgi:hypothetical protein
MWLDHQESIAEKIERAGLTVDIVLRVPRDFARELVVWASARDVMIQREPDVCRIRTTTPRLNLRYQLDESLKHNVVEAVEPNGTRSTFLADYLLAYEFPCL